MKIYYRTITPADLSCDGRRHGRIASTRPHEGDPAPSTLLRPGDKVFTLRAGSIKDAREAPPSAWTRQSHLEL